MNSSLRYHTFNRLLVQCNCTAARNSRRAPTVDCTSLNSQQASGTASSRCAVLQWSSGTKAVKTSGSPGYSTKERPACPTASAHSIHRPQRPSSSTRPPADHQWPPGPAASTYRRVRRSISASHEHRFVAAVCIMHVVIMLHQCCVQPRCPCGAWT